MKRNIRSLKLKIILISTVCILIVGVFSNAFLYRYLTGIITEKADSIDLLNLSTVEARLNESLERLQSLGNLCAYDIEVARGMRNESLGTLPQKRAVLRAQEVLARYLNAHAGIEPYVLRLMAFNEHGVRAQAVAREVNTPRDVELVMAQPVFEQLNKNGQQRILTTAPSTVTGSDCLVYLCRVYEVPSMVQRGWLYVEMSGGFIQDVLAPYAGGSLYVARADMRPFPESSPMLASPGGSGGLVRQNGRSFRLQSAPLKAAGLTLYSCQDVTFLASGGNAILFTTVVVVLTSLSVAIILAVQLSGIITKPLRRLRERLRRISQGDLRQDPSIGRGGDEIAEVGRVVNEMAQSIDGLLKESEQMHLQKKNAEIALLQSQVNPHFLYNTLDSIRWMAVIQKSPGIEKTVRSLSNLLKNLAKGASDSIPLKDEIALLMDYVDTQSVRFMELLEVKNRIPESLHSRKIVKFTLQPLVENAIFHGIEPKGECGVIELCAREEGEFLLISVLDNGVGMTPEELDALRTAAKNPHPGGMAGIGLANVDNRLKLTYGEECGLMFESEKGRYTRVTVRIRKEV